MARFGTGTLVLVGALAGLPAPALGQIIRTVEVEAPSPANPYAVSLRLDGSGDSLPVDALHRLGTVRLRHGGPVQAVALSPDGRFLASASADGAVRIWDPNTGRELRQIYRQAGSTSALAFSPDGKMLATTGTSGQILIADPATGGITRHLHCANQVSARSVVFSPDSKTVAVAGTERMIAVVDVSRGNTRYLSGHQEGGVFSVAWAPDGRTLASAGGDGTIRLWEPAQNRQAGKIDAHAGGVAVVAFAPDGKTLASAGGSAAKPDPRVILWDVATRKEIRSVAGVGPGVRALAFTPDGKALITAGGDPAARLWDLAAGKEIRRFAGHQGEVVALALAKDGKTLVTAGHDPTIHIWDVATGKDHCPLSGYGHEVSGLAFAPDSKTLAAASLDHTLRLWDVATAKEVRRYEGHQGAVAAVAMSADGRLLASTGGDGTVRLWEAGTGREIRSLPLGTQASRGWSVALAPNGTLAAAGSGDSPEASKAGATSIWETATGKLLRRFPNRRAVKTVQFSPDGKTLAWGGPDAPMALWDVGQEQPRFLPTAGAVECLAFAPDGRLLAAGTAGGNAELYETATGKLVRTFSEPVLINAYFNPAPSAPKEVRGIAFSPDGKTLAAGHGTAVRLWELHTGQARGVFIGHQGVVTACAFAPDGRTVASASADTTVLIWDPSGQLRGAEPPQPPMVYVEASKVAANDFPPANAPAPAAPDLAALWADLGGTDAVKAYRARWALTAVPRAVLPLLQRHLKPVPHLDATRLQRLLADLDAEDFPQRERASTELERLGTVVEPDLRRLLVRTASAEAFKRIKTLLDKLGPIGSTVRIRDLRALEVLEAVGNTESRQFLEELAKGEPRAQLTQEARAALTRRGAG